MCPLIGKQLVLGISKRFLPCEYMCIINDACMHGKKLIEYDPIDWKTKEFPTDLYKLAELDDFKNISFCNTCTAKDNLSEFELEKEKLMVLFSASNKCNL